MSQDQITAIYEQNSRQVLATLIRLTGDFDVAEECLQEAFAAALIQWPTEGIPKNPSAWLISTGRFKAIDLVRRQIKLRELHPEIVARVDSVRDHNDALSHQAVPDDRLRLIFTCCHPAIDPKIQVPLTLREVCGLTTEEIARAFLTSPTTMAQRIVRGKAKIRDAKIPYELPTAEDLPSRLSSVLGTVYLVYNEGYSASSGDVVTRIDLSQEAIRLARLILELLPEPDVMSLLALMLLHESRREARTSPDGEIILMEDQDRSLWNTAMIEEGKQLVERVLLSRRFSSYTIQAAISAVHADAKHSKDTDWAQIVALYSILRQIEPSPIVELNRAVAIAMRDGPTEGLKIVEQLITAGQLSEYHHLYSVHGELLRREGNFEAARRSLEKAFSMTQQEPERRLLSKKLAELQQQISHKN